MRRAQLRPPSRQLMMDGNLSGSMTPERLQAIEELYHSARESGAAVLVQADPELRCEVEKLLAQDSQSSDKLLDQNAADLAVRLCDTLVSPGSLLGPYKIEAALGEGGMGQVFRATDTRLGRTVAIKISNEKFSDRFESESRAIAALNHPNICTLHDVGPNYLVMELIEGETLAARLKRGRFSVEQSMKFGAQIAGALAAAHAKGIIHRDLKPANVMLTKSGVKVLDFGLAKSAADPALTAEGVRIGTPAYMAPEQFEGSAADQRTDIYALGLILGEMLTGKRSELSEVAPSGLVRVVKRCIERDPDERWQSTRDLKWELESTLASPVPDSSRWPRASLLVAVGAVLLLVAAFAYLRFSETFPPLEPARMTVLLPERSRPLFLAISPDGRAIALVLVKDGRQQIWIRALDSLDLTPLEGTDGATNPFWSPDSRFIGFFADARLKKIDRSGGPAQTLCDALAALGGTWNQNGDILFGGLARLQRVSATGGPVSDFLKHPPWTELYPFFLPDGDHYLATRAGNARSADNGIWLGSIHGVDSRQILPDASNAQFIGPLSGSQTGAVVFTRGDMLMALPFDAQRLEAAGDAFPIARGIASGVDYYRLAAASNAGVLAYVSGQRGGWQYVWRDRQGRKLGAYPDAGAVAMVSPAGKQLVGERAGETWVMEFAHGVATQLTFGSPGNFNPIWSPDGRYIAYDKIGVGIYRKLATGAGGEEFIVPSKSLACPKSWSPDGKFIVYAQINPGTGADLMAVPLESDRKPFPVVQTNATEDQGQFSPDGHWLAYTSNESGQGEIYVIPFPPTSGGEKWLVSRGGGVQPRWNRNGRELFYISPDSKMTSVEVNTRPVFHAGTPHPLFDSDIVDTGIRTGPLSWDISPDGNRFLIITPNSSDTSSLTMNLNWRPVATGQPHSGN
jgi:eukaryotic-like serine/threonine-protein kinase